MKRLNPPAFDSAQAIDTCASGISDLNRADALRQALPTIEEAEQNYLALGPSGELYRIAQSENVTPLLNVEQMSMIYKQHFVRAGSPSRPLYEQIRMGAEYDICPLCGQRVVTSVDHYLPKSLYPQLALTPINLVPACSDCNKSKLARSPRNAQEQSLHPYFDDLGNERWLIAEVRPSAPPTISFGIRPPSVWSEVLTTRVSNHFAMLGLAELYAAQAASELADISYALADVGNAGGSKDIRSHLERELKSRAARDPNSWKTALYDALSSSNWFCEIGYQQIRNVRISN